MTQAHAELTRKGGGLWQGAIDLCAKALWQERSVHVFKKSKEGQGI